MRRSPFGTIRVMRANCRRDVCASFPDRLLDRIFVKRATAVFFLARGPIPSPTVSRAIFPPVPFGSRKPRVVLRNVFKADGSREKEKRVERLRHDAMMMLLMTKRDNDNDRKGPPYLPGGSRALFMAAVHVVFFQYIVFSYILCTKRRRSVMADDDSC